MYVSSPFVAASSYKRDVPSMETEIRMTIII